MVVVFRTDSEREAITTLVRCAGYGKSHGTRRRGSEQGEGQTHCLHTLDVDISTMHARQLRLLKLKWIQDQDQDQDQDACILIIRLAF